MSSPLNFPANAKQIDIQKVTKIYSKLVDNHKESPEKSYLIDKFIMALIAAPSLLNCSPNSIQACWLKIWEEEIDIDNVCYSLVPQNGKMVLMEVLKHTTTRLGREFKAIFCTTVFSDKQVEYLKGKPYPEHITELPADLPPATSIYNTATIIIKLVQLESGLKIYEQQYPTETLLETARKRIIVGQNGKKSLVNERVGRGGAKIVEPATGVWASEGSDSLEMLKKTAVRKFIKYFSTSP